MAMESLDIMEKVWAGESIEHEGAYRSAAFPEAGGPHALRDMRPYGGKMTVAVAGASPGSTSIEAAGSCGLLPLSFGATPELIADHWATYVRGAEAAGREANERSAHHLTMKVFCADTGVLGSVLWIMGRGLGARCGLRRHRSCPGRCVLACHTGWPRPDVASVC